MLTLLIYYPVARRNFALITFNWLANALVYNGLSFYFRLESILFINVGTYFMYVTWCTTRVTEQLAGLYQLTQWMWAELGSCQELRTCDAYKEMLKWPLTHPFPLIRRADLKTGKSTISNRPPKSKIIFEFFFQKEENSVSASATRNHSSYT